jgi:hypothetical protein
VVDIFDEVSDDLRTERAARLFRRYGLLVLAAAVLVLLGVAAQQGWIWYQGQQANKAATAYLNITQPIDAAGPSLTNAQRTADAKQLTDFAATAPTGYQALARLRAAGLYADAGQLDMAENLWNQVGNDTATDPLLSGLANLLWAQHALGTAPDDQVAARLAPLTASQNPWHGLAQETQALLYLHQGKTAQAKALFSQLSSDPSAPDGVRNRADGLLAKLNG